jgi:5-methylcytosine-specific restriction endonuclease McrA
MRKPCKCGEVVGRIETRNGQDCVFCIACNRHQYNAPKTETGRAPRTVTTVHNGIKPGQRARVLERDSGRCVLCGSRNDLHVGHLLSVNEGVKQGLAEAEINDDENLAAMCAECNLGLADRPVPLRLAMALLVARMKLSQPPSGVA